MSYRIAFQRIKYLNTVPVRALFSMNIQRTLFMPPGVERHLITHFHGNHYTSSNYAIRTEPDDNLFRLIHRRITFALSTGPWTGGRVTIPGS